PPPGTLPARAEGAAPGVVPGWSLFSPWSWYPVLGTVHRSPRLRRGAGTAPRRSRAARHRGRSPPAPKVRHRGLSPGGRCSHRGLGTRCWGQSTGAHACGVGRGQPPGGHEPPATGDAPRPRRRCGTGGCPRVVVVLTVVLVPGVGDSPPEPTPAAWGGDSPQAVTSRPPPGTLPARAEGAAPGVVPGWSLF